MLANDYSISTVGIYIGYNNVAKDNGIIKQEFYPFGRRKYIIPTGRNVKRSLRKEEIKQIFDYETTE